VDRLRGPGEAAVEPGEPPGARRRDDELPVLFDLEREDDLQLEAAVERRLGEEDLRAGREGPEDEPDAPLRERPVDPLAKLPFPLRGKGRDAAGPEVVSDGGRRERREDPRVDPLRGAEEAQLPPRPGERREVVPGRGAGLPDRGLGRGEVAQRERGLGLARPQVCLLYTSRCV